MKNAAQGLMITRAVPQICLKTFDQPFSLKQFNDMGFRLCGTFGAGVPGLFGDLLNFFRVGTMDDMAPEPVSHIQHLFHIIMDSIMRNGPLFGEGGFHPAAVRALDPDPVAIRSLGDADNHVFEIEVDIIDDKRAQ